MSESDAGRYVLVCNEENCKAEIGVSEYVDAGWGRTLDDNENVVQVCPEHFARCNGCGRKAEDTTCVAYLLDHRQAKGLCPKCREECTKDDMDSYTRDALGKLCDVANGGNVKALAESMFRTIHRQHRYLQNELFQAFVHFFKLYGEQDENHRDARNEWAVAAARHWNKVSRDIIYRVKDGS